MTLKDLLAPDLFSQVEAAINEHNAKETDKLKHVRYVDLSEGQYVSRNKFDDTTNQLKQQVTDLQGQLSQRDTDMNDLSAKLTAAQADAGKLAEAQTALTDLQSKYETEKNDWENKTAKQAYEFAIKTEAGKLKFSSAAAQRDFIRGAIDANLKLDGDTIMGFSDYVQKYKTDDPSAFVADAPEPTQAGEQNTPPPQIVLGKNGALSEKKGLFNFEFTSVHPRPKNE